jgi:hypothetical protein
MKANIDLFSQLQSEQNIKFVSDIFVFNDDFYGSKVTDKKILEYYDKIFNVFGTVFQLNENLADLQKKFKESDERYNVEDGSLSKIFFGLFYKQLEETVAEMKENITIGKMYQQLFNDRIELILDKNLDEISKAKSENQQDIIETLSNEIKGMQQFIEDVNEMDFDDFDIPNPQDLISEDMPEDNEGEEWKQI